VGAIPSSRSQAEPAFDPAGLLDRACGDVELMRELVVLFLNESPRHCASLEEAMASANGDGIIDAAHKLRGCLLNLSAGPSSAAALKVEVLGREGRLAELPTAMKALLAELGSLRDALFATVNPERNV
jgi:HPt (histidine-containing phosphotransfer) domain-containing protein